MFIAGENSGDMHASRVITELRQIFPQAEIFGYGGERMEKAGMRLIENLAQKLPIMGFTQVIRKYPKIRALLRQAADLLRDERPDLLVLVDYPGFNLRTAKKARELGVPVAYYISPQFWAWHRSRIEIIRANVDKMLVILPFEADLYRQENIAVEYVGHPLQDDTESLKPRTQVFSGLGLDPAAEVIGLMPGSRNGEVERHLPVMLEAAEIIHQARPGAQFVIPRATTILPGLIRQHLDRFPAVPATVADSDHKSVRAAMDFVICKSGTSTLEYALAGVPMVIIYKTSAITAFIARRVLEIPHIGLVNIVAGEEVSPELWQDRASGPEIARRALEILQNPQRLASAQAKMAAVREKIGGPGASRHAAEAIAQMLA
jgi:lipid-A-disaccharide synthase